MAAPSKTTACYEGANFLRQRLVLATLSGKQLKIKNIRHRDNEPGLRDYEAGLLRLLDKLTNGSIIEVNETGTSLHYVPGMLIGGKLEHDCSLQRGIGYFVELLICLAPFCKHPVNAVLRGITNDPVDPSVDCLRQACLPVLKRFLGDDEGLELKAVKRGLKPAGGGEVLFRCPIKMKLRPIHLLDSGKIKRIRGLAFAARVAPALANRLVDAAKGVLLRHLPDVYIYTEHCRGPQGGNSPGFGLVLSAETTEGCFFSAEGCSSPQGSAAPPCVPEELGEEVAQQLLRQIFTGGCVDSDNQWCATLLMALGPGDLARFQTGALSSYSVHYLRHIRDFLRVRFRIESKQKQDDDDDEEKLQSGGERLVLSCIGIGFQNLSKTLV